MKDETHAGMNQRLKAEFNRAREETVSAATDEGQFIKEMAGRGYSVRAEDGWFPGGAFYCELQEEPNRAFIIERSKVMERINRNRDEEEVQRMNEKFDHAVDEAVRASSGEGQFIEEMAGRGYSVRPDDRWFSGDSFYCEMQEEPHSAFVIERSKIMERISRDGKQPEGEPEMRGPKL